jgi:pyridoxal phosphate enzyme (YggS family)
MQLLLGPDGQWDSQWMANEPIFRRKMKTSISMIMTTLDDNVQAIQARLNRACFDGHRARADVTLLAVSKRQSAEAVRQAHAAGLCAFGENYVQEGLDKIAALADLRTALQWHLIGPLQRNKTRAVAEAFDWVHSLDRLAIAQRLSEQRPAALAPLNVCLQVNVSGEDSKSGVAPDEVPALARAVAALPRLRLRGLMSIPAPADTLDAQREPHRALRQLFERLNADGLARRWCASARRSSARGTEPDPASPDSRPNPLESREPRPRWRIRSQTMTP